LAAADNQNVTGANRTNADKAFNSNKKNNGEFELTSVQETKTLNTQQSTPKKKRGFFKNRKEKSARKNKNK
jgi:hypothetical protein